MCSLALLHEGEVSVVKVAAHGRDRSQLPSLTRGNQMADALAKAAAKMAFAQYANLLLPEIEIAVQLHSHLVHLFFSNFSSYDQTQGDEIQPFKLERPRACGLKPRCTCAPSSRFNKKGPLICKGTCPSAFSFPSNVEQCFLSLVEKGDLVPERVWSILKARYPSFASWIDWKTHPCPAQPVSDVVPDRKRKLSLDRRELIAKSIMETGWCNGHYHNHMQYTPWAVFLIEFLVRFGWVPGFLYPELGFGTLVQRFRCHWVHFLKAAFPAMSEELSACKLLSPFGLSSVRSFGIHLIPGCKKEIWTILLLASIHCTRESFSGRKFRHAWKPDWNLVLR